MYIFIQRLSAWCNYIADFFTFMYTKLYIKKNNGSYVFDKTFLNIIVTRPENSKIHNISSLNYILIRKKILPLQFWKYPRYFSSNLNNFVKDQANHWFPCYWTTDEIGLTKHLKSILTIKSWLHHIRQCTPPVMSQMDSLINHYCTLREINNLINYTDKMVS